MTPTQTAAVLVRTQAQLARLPDTEAHAAERADLANQARRLVSEIEWGLRRKEGEG